MANLPTITGLFRQFLNEHPSDPSLEGFRCYRKPNRTVVREFNAQDAARVMCYAVRGGASQADILRRFRTICGDQGREDRPQVAEEAIALAMEALQANNQVLLDEWRAFLVVNGILLGLIALLGVIRLAGPLRIIATPLRTAARLSQVQVAHLITVNITRRAANDAVFEVLRQSLRRAA